MNILADADILRGSSMVGFLGSLPNLGKSDWTSFWTVLKNRIASFVISFFRGRFKKNLQTNSMLLDYAWVVIVTDRPGQAN